MFLTSLLLHPCPYQPLSAPKLQLTTSDYSQICVFGLNLRWAAQRNRWTVACCVPMCSQIQKTERSRGSGRRSSLPSHSFTEGPVGRFGGVAVLKRAFKPGFLADAPEPVFRGGEPGDQLGPCTAFEEPGTQLDAPEAVFWGGEPGDQLGPCT